MHGGKAESTRLQASQAPAVLSCLQLSINEARTNMSFGISIGDFIAVGRLIQDIVSSLRASSKSEYRELILELHGLQRALHEIEHLKCHPSQEPAVNGIKVAALMCQYPLDEFAGKLKQFESLGLGKAENTRISASFTTESSQEGYENLETVVEKSHQQMVGLRRDLQANESHARSNSSILTKLSGIITGYGY